MMDAIYSLAATQTHLGLPHVPGQREEPTTDAASLDVLATAAAASDPPPPPEYIHASSREIAGVMDAIYSLAATQTHLGLPHVPGQREEPTTDAASLDVLAAAAAASDPPPPQQ